MDKKTQINIWYVFLAIFGVVLLRDLWVESQTIEAIPYSQFETYLDKGQVDEVVVGSNTIRGTFKTPQDGKSGFITTTVPPDMAARLEGHDVTFTGAVENTWFTTLLSWVLPALIFVGIWIFFIRKFAEKQGMGGFMSIGKSRAKIYVESDTKVSFDDVVAEGSRLTFGGAWRQDDLRGSQATGFARLRIPLGKSAGGGDPSEASFHARMTQRVVRDADIIVAPSQGEVTMDVAENLTDAGSGDDLNAYFVAQNGSEALE